MGCLLLTANMQTGPGLSVGPRSWQIMGVLQTFVEEDEIDA